MIILGSVLNYYIDSPIAIAFIMFSVSFIMNRTRTPKQSADTSSERDSKTVKKRTPNTGFKYCSNCGNQLKASTRFCSSCGSPIETPLTNTLREQPIETYSPSEIHYQIKTLNTRYQFGGLDESSYMNILNSSMFQDGWNRTWAVGANTLHWYRYDKGSWIKDTPTGNLMFT